MLGRKAIRPYTLVVARFIGRFSLENPTIFS